MEIVKTLFSWFRICVSVSPCSPCGSEPFSIGIAHMMITFRWTWSRARISPKHNITPAGTCKFPLIFQEIFWTASSSRGSKSRNMLETFPKQRAYTTSNISEARPDRLSYKKVRAKFWFQLLFPVHGMLGAAGRDTQAHSRAGGGRCIPRNQMGLSRKVQDRRILN